MGPYSLLFFESRPHFLNALFVREANMSPLVKMVKAIEM